MRSRKRGKEESGGGGEGEDEKQDRLLSRSRGFTTHVWSDGLWSVVRRRAASLGGDGLLLGYWANWATLELFHGWTR